MCVVVEGAGDQDIEICIAGFPGGGHQIGAGELEQAMLYARRFLTLGPLVAVAMGLLLEYLLQATTWQVDARLGETGMMLPMPLAWGSAIVLLVLGIRPLRRLLFPRLG